MPRKKRNEVRFSVPVTPEQKTVLEAMAERDRVPLAHVARQAITEFLQKRHGGQLPLFDTLPPSSEEDSGAGGT